MREVELLSTTAPVQPLSQHSVVVNRRVVTLCRVEAPDIVREVLVVRTRDIVVDVLCAVGAVGAVKGDGGRNDGEVSVAGSFDTAPGKADTGNGSRVAWLGLDSSSAANRADGSMFMLLELGPSSAANKADGSSLKVFELKLDLDLDHSKTAIRANASIVAVLEARFDDDAVVRSVIAILARLLVRLVLDFGVEVLIIDDTVVVVAIT